MAKRKVTVEEPSDDEIIANGLAFIREGILSLDWQKVLDGFVLITGENIEIPVPEKKKSRLENIRAKMAQKTEPSEKLGVDTTEEPEVKPLALVESKTENGLLIISTEQNAEEFAANQKKIASIGIQKMPPKKRTEPLKDTSHLPESTEGPRFYTSNKPLRGK